LAIRLAQIAVVQVLHDRVYRGTAVSTSADNVESLEAPFAPAGGNVCAIDTLGDSAVARLVGLPLTLVTRSSAIAVLRPPMASGAEPRRIHRPAL